MLKSESLQLQKKFRKYNFDVILCPEMEQYIDRNVFPENYSLRQRIEVENFKCLPSTIKNGEAIKIVHSPSNKAGKGTDYVIKAIEELKKKYNNIDFKLIHNVPHKEAIKMVRECDIFIDQFIIGSYGMAALEAMAMGKTVFCYIKNSVVNQYPEELPFINSTIHTLKDKLENFIVNPSELNIIGKKSRVYVEKYHSTNVLIPELIKIYTNKINRKNNL
jgi:glycosyltransferase involved in cell wall biosynthesis